MASSAPLSAEIPTSRYTCVACYKPEPKDEKFLSCGGCRRTAYCSKDCQRKDWKRHKAICQAQAQNRESLPKRGSSERDQLSSIKKWFSKHTQLLLYGGTHAFQLHDRANFPRLKTHMLVVHLDEALAGKRGEFTFRSVGLCPMADFVHSVTTRAALAERVDMAARDHRHSLTMFVRSGNAVYLAPITVPRCKTPLEHAARWGPPNGGWAEFMERSINNTLEPSDDLTIARLHLLC